MYQDPKKVVAPQKRWRLIDVLANDGPDATSVALGLWDQSPTLGIRWNGDTSGNGVGSPQSRGLPTWFILPEYLHGSILSALEGWPEVDATALKIAKSLLA